MGHLPDPHQKICYVFNRYVRYVTSLFWVHTSCRPLLVSHVPSIIWKALPFIFNLLYLSFKFWCNCHHSSTLAFNVPLLLECRSQNLYNTICHQNLDPPLYITVSCMVLPSPIVCKCTMGREYDPNFYNIYITQSNDKHKIDISVVLPDCPGKLFSKWTWNWNLGFIYETFIDLT